MAPESAQPRIAEAFNSVSSIAFVSNATLIVLRHVEVDTDENPFSGNFAMGNQIGEQDCFHRFVQGSN